jgi:hypothetical protein
MFSRPSQSGTDLSLSFRPLGIGNPLAEFLQIRYVGALQIHYDGCVPGSTSGNRPIIAFPCQSECIA